MKVNTCLCLDIPTRRILKRYAANHDTSMSQVVTRLINENLKWKEKTRKRRNYEERD